MDSQTINFIQENINKNDYYQNSWTEIFNLYSKKLWHQLTLSIEKLVNIPDFREAVDLKVFYEQLVSNFENKMNSLALARVCIIIGHQILERQNADAAILFLNKIVSKLTGVNAKEATVLTLTEVGMMHLNSQKNLMTAREVIEKTDALLNDLGCVTSAHAPFYKLSSSYHSSMRDYSSFYREALKYLSCLSPEQFNCLSAKEKEQWAVKLCVSALLGRNIYNFGELLMHDIVNSIGEDNLYLLELVRGFNEGSIAKVTALQTKLMSQSDLANDTAFLEEKITLMCLVEMIFQRPVNQRTVSFAEVAQATRVEVDAVILLVMKAMSKGLIKGGIDEVNERVMVKWVQPRVLNMAQIANIQANISHWTSSVAEMGDLINNNAKEILH